MAQEGNKYADKIFSEHPIALWPLDEQAYYLSQIDDTERNFTNWSDTGAATWSTIAVVLPNDASPFDDDYYSAFKKDSSATGTMELVSPNLFSTTDVSAEIPNFTINLFMYFKPVYVNWIRYGIRYNSALAVPQEIISAQIPAPTAASWVNLNQTYNLPSSWSGSIKFFIQINMDDSTGDATAREFIMNGLSVGQGSEPTAYESLGVNPVALPAELNLAAFLGVPADQYGLSSEVGYYLVRNNALLARNDGLPIIYGTDHSTKIYDTVYGFPSLVFPGKGMLHEKGRNKYYTLEAWMKIDPLTTTAHKVIGPLDSNDGVYVKEGFMTLVIGDEIGSYCASEWYRPMLLHVVLKEANATVMVNGEEVISIPLNRRSVELPTLRDWWGVYSYQEVGAFTIDTISIFPYIVSNAVAKRRFVYGLGTPNPQSIDAAFYGTSTEIEFSTAEYNNSVIYPDIARWDAGYFNNLTATKDYLAVPSYSLPRISLAGRDVQEWYDNNYTINTSEYPDGNHPRFVSLRPNQVTRTNLVTNPSFEANTAGWAAGSNATITRVTSQAYVGTASLQLTKGGTGGGNAYALTNITGKPRTTYTFSAWVRCASGTVAGAQVILTDGNTNVGTTVTATTTWTKVSVTMTPATGFTVGGAYFTLDPAAINTTVFFDGAIIEEGASTGDYFDGSYISPTIKPIGTQSWTGTAHASTSTVTTWNPTGINYQDPAYLNFPSLNVLNDQVTAVYGVFQTESSIATDRPLISFVNVVNGDRFDIVSNVDEITYRLNSTDLYTEVITLGTEFVVGVNFDEAGLNFGYDVSRFFSSPSSVQVFIGGDGTTTYEGKIYTVGFANANNYKYVQSYFYGTGLAGRGLINPDFYDIMLDHIASYTLVPEYEYGHLFLDIAVAAEWEEYFPLSYFASYVIDEDGNSVYDLDMLQINMSYTSIISTDIWNYYDLQQAYATYALLNAGPFANYFNLEKQNTTGDTIDVSNSAIQTYITFQPIASGANAPLSEFTYGKALSGTLVIDADAENTGVEPARAYDTIYAFRDNTVVFPPKSKNFEDYAMVVHLIIKQRSTLKNPLRVKRFEITSKNFNYNAANGSNDNRTQVGTKFGKKLFPQSNVYGGAIDHKWNNPYMIYKASTPYLYTTKYSGVKVANETYVATPMPTQNEVFIPINESGAFQYKVAAVQLMIRPDFLSETAETKIMEIRHRDGTLAFTATKQGDFANIKAYKRSEAVYVDGGSPSTPSYLGDFNGGVSDSYYTQYMNVTTGMSPIVGLVSDEYTLVHGTEFYQNGRFVSNPLLKFGEWTAIGMSLPTELSFDEYQDGGIALFGGFVFNNISYYQSDGLGIESTIISRTWQGTIDDQVPAQPAPPNIWSRWTGDDWEYIYVLGTDIDFSSTPEDIFNAYMGTNSLIIDDGNRIDMRQKEVKLITSATWSNYADKPA